MLQGVCHFLGLDDLRTDYNLEQYGESPDNPPIFNIPKIVIYVFLSFVLVQLFRTFAGKEWDDWLILNFAFSPARLSPPPSMVGLQFPGGIAADIWTFFTHALIHGDWEHLGFNSIWMFVFGTVVARRLNAARFLMFSIYTAGFGAVAYYLFNFGSFTFLIGASGAISGMMGGAVRLMYSVEGGLSNLSRPEFNDVKLLSLKEIIHNKSAMMFVLVWMVLNLVFGISGFGAGGSVSSIAWEAHLGGFLSGFILFGFFDPQENAESLFSKIWRSKK